MLREIRQLLWNTCCIIAQSNNLAQTVQQLQQVMKCPDTKIARHLRVHESDRLFPDQRLRMALRRIITQTMGSAMLTASNTDQEFLDALQETMIEATKNAEDN